jgi:alpha-methylacyl-CoA racemase
MGSPPLTGISVVELAGIGPGPFAASLLAELGADVVRIERPAAAANGLPGGLDRIGIRDRLVIEADLKSPGGLGIVRSLIAHADVAIEGFRPGVAERLGVGPDDMCAANRALVYARMTGWGQDGPYAAMAGHDINYIGLAGVLGAIGPDDPVPPLNLVGDYGGGGMFAVAGILAALVARSQTGEGTVLDVAMVDGAAKLLEPIRDLLNVGLWSEHRGTNLLDGGAPFYRAYHTSDGGFVAVGALEPSFYDALVSGLGLDPGVLPDRMDPANWDDLTQRFATVFATRTRDEWSETFDGTDACVTPVLGMSEVGSHRHNAARDALVPGPHGPVPARAPRFTTVTQVPSRPPVSDTLMALGLDEQVITDLEEGHAAYRI